MGENNEDHSDVSSSRFFNRDCFLMFRVLIIGGILFYVVAYSIHVGVPIIKISLHDQNLDHDQTLSFDFREYKISETKTKQAKRDKVIFYWNSFLNRQDWHRGFGHDPFADCDYKNCITTNDKQKFNDSDAMLCHMRTNGCDLNQLPRVRKPHQYWIYFLKESPVISRSGEYLKRYNGIFNLTATYKLDSDLIAAYDRTSLLIERTQDESYSFYKGKSASVAWVASHCASGQGRGTYISHLEKHIQVKRYGRCRGHNPCGINCFEDVAKEHKFYFAAENSLCKDYITEKPFNALEVGMIPIVYGLGDYSKILPPDSYIDVRDFKSPHLVADYLKHVASNRTLYNSYFKWRDLYRTMESKRSSDYLCQLCTFLNQPNPPRKIVNNMEKFWSKANDCKDTDAFNQLVIQE